MACRPIRSRHSFRHRSRMARTCHGGRTARSPRLPEQLNLSFSIQHQFTNSLVLDVGYNGVAGSHLQAGPAELQPTAVLGPPASTARRPLALKLQPPRAQAAQTCRARIPRSLRQFHQGFRQQRYARARPCARSRNTPTINTWDGNGDHSGHSKLPRRAYQAGKALRIRAGVHQLLCLLQADDRR